MALIKAILLLIKKRKAVNHRLNSDLTVDFDRRPMTKTWCHPHFPELLRIAVDELKVDRNDGGEDGLVVTHQWTKTSRLTLLLSTCHLSERGETTLRRTNMKVLAKNVSPPLLDRSVCASSKIAMHAWEGEKKRVDWKKDGWLVWTSPFNTASTKRETAAMMSLWNFLSFTKRKIDFDLFVLWVCVWGSFNAISTCQTQQRRQLWSRH